MNSSRLLVIVVALQSLILLGQWTGSNLLLPAQAQVPDSGSQRYQMIEELKALNGKMDRLIQVLEGGKLQVQVATPDEKK